MEKVRYLYVVHDTVADEYGPIFEAVNDQVAHRSFKTILKQATYPDDFQLVSLGYINDDMVLISELRDVNIILESMEKRDGKLPVLEVQSE